MSIVHIKTIKGGILFIIQYLCLAYLIFSGSFYPAEWFTWIPYFAGMVLGFWAIIAMGRNNLNTTPDILPDARLVTSGPYRIIRHPMYAAILLVFSPLVFTSISNIRYAVLAVLTLNLLLKISYEERRLQGNFLGYSEYSERTWRLLPYVY